MEQPIHPRYTYLTNPPPLAGPCPRTVETSPDLKRRVLDPQSSGAFREFRSSEAERGKCVFPMILPGLTMTHVWKLYFFSCFFGDLHSNNYTCYHCIYIYMYICQFRLFELVPPGTLQPQISGYILPHTLRALKLRMAI